MTAVLRVWVLIGGGLTAGVLFAVALSVVPAFHAVPAQRYVALHKLVGQRFDRVMPALVLACTLADLTLAVRVGDATARVLFAGAAALLLGVSLVSQLGNVPINRAVKRTPPGELPADWSDPRPRWRVLHLVRTSFAVLAIIANACAVVLFG